MRESAYQHAFSSMGRALSNISRQFDSEHSNGRMSDPVTLNTLRWLALADCKRS